MHVYKIIYDSLFVFIIKVQVEPCHLLYISRNAWSRNSVYFRHGGLWKKIHIHGKYVFLTL